MKFKKTALAVIVLLFISIYGVYSQEADKIDYNMYYNYPLSVGVDYSTFNPFSDYGVDTFTYEFALNVRYPLPFDPRITPFVRGGITYVDSKDNIEPEKWDHKHYFISGGGLFINRINKNFEIGGGLGGGFAQGVFTGLEEDTSYGAKNVFGSLLGVIGLNPSYNMNISVMPELKYRHFLSPLEKFKGLSFGIGFSMNYRFGLDPDSPKAIIKSIKLLKAEIPAVFAAMQSYYVNNPIGTIQISNIEDFAINDVEISFYQAGFMDTPAKIITIPEIEKGGEVTVDLPVTFNNNVFETEGITPLNGEIIVEYMSRTRGAKQTFPVKYELHDKTSLTWTDDRKVGAFITPADSALRNYSSYVKQVCKETVNNGFSEKLQSGIQVYYGLKELGCLYQVDPTSPFVSAKGNAMIVDSINLARTTLKRAVGDCDDLTVLYSSLLETLGIETSFITIPGHIYPAFNTGIPSREYMKVHPDKNMTINLNGELWIPVEITMVGEKDFMTAWKKGIDEYRLYDNEPESRGFNITGNAQKIYRPVALKETDLGLQYGEKVNIVSGVEKGLDRLIDVVITHYRDDAEKEDKKTSFNKLGILAAQYGRYEVAEESFNRALEKDKNYIQPKINVGNLYFLQEEYENALRNYHRAEKELENLNRQKSSLYLKVVLNISRSYYELEEYERAGQYYDAMRELNPELAAKFNYLEKVADDGSRASDMSGGLPVLFGDETDNLSQDAE